MILCFLVVLNACIIDVNGLFNLTVLHTNDFHARYDETDKYSGQCTEPGACFGGSARIKTKVDDIRAQIANTIFLDAGDQYQGTLWFYQYGWQVVAHFMNLLGYDVMALGNHEFDRGVEGLLPFLSNVTFPVISSNINTTKVPAIQNKFAKSVTLTVGGERIGIIGYTTTETKIASSPGDLEFVDEVTAIRAEVANLEADGVNKIIALGHAGFLVDRKIASEVKGLDVVVGGHTNTFLYTGEAPSDEVPVGQYPYIETQADGTEVLCVQDYAYGKYLGFLQLSFDDNGKIIHYGGNPILLNNSVPQDSTVKSEVSEWRQELTAIETSVIGRSLVHLEGMRSICRMQECNLGNMLADALVHQNLRHADSIQGLGVFIGLWNAGGIRDSIPSGSITLRHVLDVVPFMNTVDTIKLKGKYLLQALENSVAQYDPLDPRGRFLQVSGIRVTYNLSRPAWDRVVDVQVLCGNCSVPEFLPLDVNEMYSIILQSYMRYGGDGFFMIKEHAIQDHLIGDLDSDVVTEYIKAVSPIYTGLEGRIKFDNSTTVTCSETTTEKSFIPTTIPSTLQPTTPGPTTPRPTTLQPSTEQTRKPSTMSTDKEKPCIPITVSQCPRCPLEDQTTTIEELKNTKANQNTIIVILAVVCAVLGVLLIIVSIYTFRKSLRSKSSQHYKFDKAFDNGAYQG